MSTAENKSLTSRTQGETLIKWPSSPGAQPFPVSPSRFSGCLPSPGQEEGLGRKGYTAQDHELSAERQRIRAHGERTVDSEAYSTIVQAFPKKQRRFKMLFFSQFLENIFIY